MPQEKELKDKLILVSGGTGNGGSGIVRTSLKNNASVIVPYRNLEKFQYLIS